MKLSKPNVMFMKDEYTYPREVQGLCRIPLAEDAGMGNRPGKAHDPTGLRALPGSEPALVIGMAEGQYHAFYRQDRTPCRQTWERSL